MLPCGAANCNLCPLVKPSTTFQDSCSPLSFPITSRLSCNSSHVIYIIECRACLRKYVGETSRPLSQRIQQHLRAIRDNSTCLVHSHFRGPCTPTSFSFYAIARHSQDHVRKAKEEKFISVLHTRLPSGLNKKSNDCAPKTNLILPFCNCAVRVASALKHWIPRDLFRVAFQRTRSLKELCSRSQR